VNEHLLGLGFEVHGGEKANRVLSRIWTVGLLGQEFGVGYAGSRMNVMMNVLSTASCNVSPYKCTVKPCTALLKHHRDEAAVRCCKGTGSLGLGLGQASQQAEVQRPRKPSPQETRSEAVDDR